MENFGSDYAALLRVNALGMPDYVNFAYLLALLPILMEILWTRNSAGFSVHTQLLFVIVFTINDVLHFNWLTTVVAALTYCTTILIFIMRKPEQKKHDNFRIELLIFSCLIFAVFINHGLTLVNVLLVFSICLEAVAIIPQIHLVSRAKFLEPIVYYYVFIMSMYKLYHLVNWMFIYYNYRKLDNIAVAGVIVQLIFYADFFVTHVRYIEQIEYEASEEENRITNKNVDVECEKTMLADSPLREVKCDNFQPIILTPVSLLIDEKIRTDGTGTKKVNG